MKSDRSNKIESKSNIEIKIVDIESYQSRIENIFQSKYFDVYIHLISVIFFNTKKDKLSKNLSPNTKQISWKNVYFKLFPPIEKKPKKVDLSTKSNINNRSLLKKNFVKRTKNEDINYDENSSRKVTENDSERTQRTSYINIQALNKEIYKPIFKYLLHKAKFELEFLYKEAKKFKIPIFTFVRSYISKMVYLHRNYINKKKELEKQLKYSINISINKDELKKLGSSNINGTVKTEYSTKNNFFRMSTKNLDDIEKNSNRNSKKESDEKENDQLKGGIDINEIRNKIQKLKEESKVSQYELQTKLSRIKYRNIKSRYLDVFQNKIFSFPRVIKSNSKSKHSIYLMNSISSKTSINKGFNIFLNNNKFFTNDEDSIKINDGCTSIQSPSSPNSKSLKKFTIFNKSLTDFKINNNKTKLFYNSDKKNLKKYNVKLSKESFSYKNNDYQSPYKINYSNAKSFYMNPSSNPNFNTIFSESKLNNYSYLLNKKSNKYCGNRGFLSTQNSFKQNSKITSFLGKNDMYY